MKSEQILLLHLLRLMQRLLQKEGVQTMMVEFNASRVYQIRLQDLLCFFLGLPLHRLRDHLIRFLFFASFLFVTDSVWALDRSLDQGLDEIAQKITKSIPEGSRKGVAVMDFNTLDGSVTVLGRFIGEELITRLFETERLKVIERSLLEKAIEELKFNTSDLVDPTIAKQVGKVVGADAIVTGTLSDLGDSVKINARVIMVESGEVIGAAGAQIMKDTAIRDMLSKSLNSSFRSGQKMREEIESETSSKVIEKTELPGKSQWIADVKDYLFELHNCISYARSITCNLSIVNKGKDRELTIGTIQYRVDHRAYTIMYDNFGNEYRAGRFTLANNSQDNKGVKSFLVSGVPVKATVKFEEVSPQASSISLLKIECQLSHWGDPFEIEFRNVPIDR